jgi:hypothetical protein
MFRYVSARALAASILLVVSLSASPAYASNEWEQVGDDILGTLTSTDAGRSVAVNQDGSIVAVGSWEDATTGPGSVRVYELVTGAWVQKGLALVGAADADFFAVDVELSADGLTLAIGSPYNTSRTGQVFVYAWNGTAWIAKGSTLVGAGTNRDFGFAVSLSADGDTLAVGAPNEDGAVGNVYVYSWSDPTWGLVGSRIPGDSAVVGSGFGRALDLNSAGTVVVIGARSAPSGGVFPGVARVYGFTGSAWNQQGADIPGEANSDRFGHAVAINGDGTIIAVGAYENDGGGASAGQVRVLGFDGSNWNQRGADIDGLAAGDEWGYAVSLSSDGLSVAAGGPDDSSSPSATGKARVLRYTNSSWTQQGQTLLGRTTGELLGNSVALSSDATTVILGAPNDDTVTTNSGLARVFRFVGATAESSATSAGVPGIYLHVAGPVGRQAEGSPVYYGSDRVAVTSSYLLSITHHETLTTTRVLASGVVDAEGNLEAKALLPALRPGSYDVVFQGKHRGGAGLRLTARIIAGNAGQITVLGDNTSQLW